jgi:hypothetical protein
MYAPGVVACFATRSLSVPQESREIIAPFAHQSSATGNGIGAIRLPGGSTVSIRASDVEIRAHPILQLALWPLPRAPDGDASFWRHNEDPTVPFDELRKIYDAWATQNPERYPPIPAADWTEIKGALQREGVFKARAVSPREIE